MRQNEGRWLGFLDPTGVGCRAKWLKSGHCSSRTWKKHLKAIQRTSGPWFQLARWPVTEAWDGPSLRALWLGPQWTPGHSAAQSPVGTALPTQRQTHCPGESGRQKLNQRLLLQTSVLMGFSFCQVQGLSPPLPSDSHPPALEGGVLTKSFRKHTPCLGLRLHSAEAFASGQAVYLLSHSYLMQMIFS